MRILVDTNILSEARRPAGNARVKSFLSPDSSAEFYISVITLGEIAFGINRLPNGRQKAELQNWLLMIQATYQSRILPVTPEVALLWGDLTAQALSKGITIAPADAYIAATALQHNLILATRNVRDFAETGVSVVDPTTL